MINPLPFVSLANEKMHDTPSFSVSPVATCPPDAPCKRDCYACRLAVVRPEVSASWRHNTQLATRPRELWSRLSAWLAYATPRRFRFHVAGDFPTRRYLGLFLNTAAEHPRIRFFGFTKRYRWLIDAAHAVPANVSVVLSAWPGYPLPAAARDHFPIAWLRSRKQPDLRLPANAKACPGDCLDCDFHCARLRPGQSVVFKKR